MSLLNLDAVILCVFLAFTLLIGIRYSTKVTSLRDYAVGNAQFSNVVLFATLSATVVGGYWLVGISGEFYDAGIISFFVVGGTLIGFSIALFVMLPNIDERFKDSISVADISRTLYGKIPSKITAFFSMIHCGATLCMQFIALGNVLAQFLDIPFYYGVFIPAVILVLYSTMGGIRSVAMTDLIQFCVIIVMVPLLAKFAIDSNDGIINVFSSVPHDKLSFDAVFHHPLFSQYLFLFLSYCLPFASLEATIVQRMLMCKDLKTRNKISFSFLAVMAFILIMGLFIAFSTLLVSSDTGGAKVFATAIGAFFPTGLKGLMIAGLVAAIMSTADSCLNTASVLAAQLFNLGKKGEKSVLYIKLATLIISFFTLLFSIINPYIIKIGIFGEICAVVFVNVPLFFGICRFKVTKRLYFISSAVCSIVMFIALISGVSIKFLPLICALLSSFILLSNYIISFNYINFILNIPKNTIFIFAEIFGFFKMYNHFFKLITEYCYNTFQNYNFSYFPFALFCVLNYVFPLLNQNYLYTNSFSVSTVFYIIAILLCIILLIRKRLHNISDTVFSIYWIFTLLYCLPFMSTFLFLQNSNSLAWLANMILGIMLLASIVPWNLFIILTVIGSFSALGISFVLTPRNTFYFTENNLDIVAYAIFLSLIIGGLFIRHRQTQQEENASEKERTSIMQLFSGAIAHELRAPLAATQMQANMLIDIMNDQDAEVQSPYNDIVRESAQQLKRLTARGLQTIEMLLLAVKDDLIIQDGGNYSIKDCVDASIDEYLLAHPELKSFIRSEINEKNDFYFTGSSIFTKHIILNLISNAFNHGGKGVEVVLSVENNILHIKDNGAGIPPEVLDKIFNKFYTTSQKGTGIGLAFCVEAMKKMSGSIKCESVVGEHTTFSLHFQQNMENIRK